MVSLLGACICTVLLVVAFSVSAVRHNWVEWHFTELLAYQLGKLERGRRIDVLLVGDSSLGNAVDARQWSQELGRNAVSVALTGVYGLGGSLNMIRRGLRHNAVTVVVIMQTMDTMTRPPNDGGILFTAETIQDARDASLIGIFRSLASMDIVDRAFTRFFSGRGAPGTDYHRVDYVPQGALLPLTRSPPYGQFVVESVVNDNLVYLEKISQECRRAGITCVYMHGPAAEPLCSNSTHYANHVSDLVERAGLRVVRDLVCLPWEDVGDAIDHVAPAKKDIYSRQILRRVTALLALDSAGHPFAEVRPAH